MISDIELFENFFQEKKDYYLEKLKLHHQGIKITFNFTALFFGLFWFLYRKMYLEAAIIYSFTVVESIGEQIFLPQLMGQDNSFICSIISTVMIFLIVGFTGNVLYIKKSLKVVGKAKKQFQISKYKKHGFIKKAEQALFILA